jgi:hypothetical protein
VCHGVYRRVVPRDAVQQALAVIRVRDALATRWKGMIGEVARGRDDTSRRRRPCDCKEFMIFERPAGNADWFP